MIRLVFVAATVTERANREFTEPGLNPEPGQNTTSLEDRSLRPHLRFEILTLYAQG